jgi:membrane protein DedA with SNARE-associated domain
MLVDMSARLLDVLSGLPAGWVYAVVFLLVFAEDAVLVGFLLPGETAAILGGVTASVGHTDLTLMIIVVVVAAIGGDSVGYQVGRHYGVRLISRKPLARRRKQIDEARSTLSRRGGPAVFVARFVAFLRAMMPFLAGAAPLRYRTFLAYNAFGGIAWGVSSVLIGYLAGLSFQSVAQVFGTATAIVAAVLIIAALIVYRVRRN